MASAAKIDDENYQRRFFESKVLERFNMPGSRPTNVANWLLRVPSSQNEIALALRVRD